MSHQQKLVILAIGSCCCPSLPNSVSDPSCHPPPPTFNGLLCHQRAVGGWQRAEGRGQSADFWMVECQRRWWSGPSYSICCQLLQLSCTLCSSCHPFGQFTAYKYTHWYIHTHIYIYIYTFVLESHWKLLCCMSVCKGHAPLYSMDCNHTNIDRDTTTSILHKHTFVCTYVCRHVCTCVCLWDMYIFYTFKSSLHGGTLWYIEGVFYKLYTYGHTYVHVSIYLYTVVLLWDIIIFVFVWMEERSP